MTTTRPSVSTESLFSNLRQSHSKFCDVSCEVFTLRSSRNFLRAVYPSQAQDKFKENKNPVFIIFLGLEDYDGFKGRRSLSRHSSQGSANFGLNPLHVGIHTKEVGV